MAPAPGMILQNRYRVQKLLHGSNEKHTTVPYLLYQAEDLTSTLPVLLQVFAPPLEPGEKDGAPDIFYSSDDTRAFANKPTAEKLAGLVHHLSAIHHPNLLPIFDGFQFEEYCYLVLKSVPGQTLRSYCEQYPYQVQEVRVIDWGVQICDALNALHTQTLPVLGTALTPDTILRKPNGRLQLTGHTWASLFAETHYLPGYTAPERYGIKKPDIRADIYSVGVLLHTLLTGSDPEHLPFVFAPANQLKSAVSKDLTAVLIQATDVDPEQRYSSLAHLRQALQEVRPDVSEETGVPSSLPPLTPSAGSPGSDEGIGTRLGSWSVVSHSSTSLALSEPVAAPLIFTEADRRNRRIQLTWIWVIFTALLVIAFGLAKLPNQFSSLVHQPTIQYPASGHLQIEANSVKSAQLVSISNLSNPVIVLHPGQSQTVTVVWRNAGTPTWRRRYTPHPVRMRPSDRQSQMSMFVSRGFADMVEEEVSPNDTATFIVTLTAPPDAKEGFYYDEWNLRLDGIYWLSDSDVEFAIHIVK